MLVIIKGFDHYKYDLENKIVLSFYQKKEKLIWLNIQGRRRVTLYQNKKPHYLFENQILDLLELNQDELINYRQSLVKIKKERVKKEKGDSSTFKDDVEENDLDNQIREDDRNFQEKLKKVQDFFLRERNGKPYRRDQFINKFGLELLEDMLYSNYLTEEKIGSFKFYNLKK